MQKLYSPADATHSHHSHCHPPPSPVTDPLLAPPLPQGYGWFFLAYEATVHAMLEPGQGRDQLTFNQIATAGIMAGFGLWGSMFPIDTIKSKIQADSFTRPLYSGFRACLRWTLASEGRAGLWRGASAALLRAVPVGAAVSLVVEGTRGLLTHSSASVLAGDAGAQLTSRAHA